MTSEFTAQNANAWDEIADVRQRVRTKPASYYADGNTTLNPRLVEAAGDLAGRSVVHFQCSTGEEVLSWAILGAKASGLDISPRQIDLARAKATEAGVDATFYAGDVLDPPSDLAAGTFDLLHTGGGALMWVPNISRWAVSVASALRVGGRLLLLEEHPVAGCLAFEDGRLLIESDYFSRAQPEAHTGWRHFEGGEDAKETKYQFQWPLGDIVTALVNAGMRIDTLAEYPSRAKWRYGDRLEEARSLPGEYLLTATRDR